MLQVSKVLGLSCNSPVGPGQTSKCTCSVQSPGPASIGWQGATPERLQHGELRQQHAGQLPVTCTVNGVAVATTSVVVRARETGGTIRVQNTAERLRPPRRKVLAQLQPAASPPGSGCSLGKSAGGAQEVNPARPSRSAV